MRNIFSAVKNAGSAFFPPVLSPFLTLLDRVFDLGPDVQRWRRDGEYPPRFSPLH